MNIIDGKKIADKIKSEIAKEVNDMLNNNIKVPHLAAIIVGEDPASQTYVANKEKACREVGFISSVYKYPASISEKELLAAIEFINNDDDIDGLIVQQPLPKHISVDKVIEKINYTKDVDGFHPINFGRMASNLPAYIAATPLGILELLKRSGVETEGKHCVILGRSHIVGSPMSILLARNTNPGNCTVTICHSKTKNIKDITKQADILIVAIGKLEFVTADMVKEGAVVIDVGMHRIPSTETKSGFRLKGDVKYDEVSKKCSAITPVPGGVGPMTITALLMNTLRAIKKEIQ
ncbi:MAG: bifunctional 5,10-methylene-tetrahydrofolate dehydrogenase/5,10-methylene-tetrahydrofolate cyclohydrolase [Bacteroidetes bacterium CG2_30_32_10]|nr:MAG: bifunctional 5,10-methylene-tetrahydrofolate dehydrogenase/5,10-methylene-tetrahydrofolate cyclohydrolase [Bacteroidetes bacterium CG2_30_32_10]